MLAGLQAGPPLNGQAAPGAEPAALLEQARRLRVEGRTVEAGEAYRQWLTSAPPDAQYAVVLREAVDSQRSSQTILRLLADFGPRVPDPAARAEFQIERVDLLRLLGRYDEALGAVRQLPESPRRLYLEALLFQEQGLLEESMEAAGRALAASPEAELGARIRHVLARSLLSAGKLGEAEAVLQAALAELADSAETPALLLAQVELLAAAERQEEAAAAAAELSKRFPSSPESALGARVAGGVPGADSPPGLSYAPSPGRLLPEGVPGLMGGAPAAGAPAAGAPEVGAPGKGTEGVRPETAPDPPAPATPDPPAPATPNPPAPAAPSAAASAAPAGPLVRLQTGSFRDPENAAYMVRDLKAKGFAAEAVTALAGDIQYHRVLVGPAQSVAQAQDLLVRLKEAGFEGMLYFP